MYYVNNFDTFLSINRLGTLSDSCYKNRGASKTFYRNQDLTDLTRK